VSQHDGPVLFVIHGGPRELAAFERLLHSRYGTDYRAMAEHSSATGFDLLEQLAHRGDNVALVAADL
jgi:hypothetical protein